MLLRSVAGLALIYSCGSVRAQDVPCAFDDATLSYAGTPREQARCLLRPVLKGGHIGAPVKKLPSQLEKLIGKSVEIDRLTLARYLRDQGINEADIGGAIADPLSRANLTEAASPLARYFVIHDVSTPNYLDAPFPANINEPAWAWNELDKKWKNKKVTHVYISRTGASVTAVDFKSPLPDPNHGTKFARDHLRNKGKGLYLHIELVQPRRRDPAGSPTNDAIAPVPGFTDAQFERLALVYIAASVRRGEWLIPAFHATIDVGIPDAHDDPQNFDITLWSHQIRLILKKLEVAKKKYDVKKVTFHRQPTSTGRG